MASKTLPTKETQKARYATMMENRSKALKEQGRSDVSIVRDPKMKHYKAKIRQINGALARIAFLEEQNRKLAELKEQRKAEAAAERAAVIAGEVTGKKAKAEEAKTEAPSKKGGKAPAKAPTKAPAKGGKPDTKKKGK
jgi:hypothetical protein